MVLKYVSCVNDQTFGDVLRELNTNLLKTRQINNEGEGDHGEDIPTHKGWPVIPLAQPRPGLPNQG